MRIYHIATVKDWLAARSSGAYTTSTYGRTLEDEGFIHAARREQVQLVFDRYYRTVDEPLVLLTINPAKLTSPWQEDPVGEEIYPHIYGPINRSAVVEAESLDKRGKVEGFLGIFFKEMLIRMGLAVLAMLMSFGGGKLGAQLNSETGSFGGALAGLMLGITTYVLVLAWRRGRT